MTHRSGPAPKDAREKSEAPTMPPPAKVSERVASRSRRDEGRVSGVQGVKPGMPAATIDEVTADMSKDPRRERDDDEEPKDGTDDDGPDDDGPDGDDRP